MKNNPRFGYFRSLDAVHRLGAIPQGFAGDSLEVVHTNIAPNAVLRSDSAIQASYITTNDSREFDLYYNV
jgi:hypothetical protein